MPIFFLLLCIFFNSALFSQFSGYSSVSNSSYNASLSSLGTGIRDDLGSFHGNPAFLSGLKKHRAEVNIQSGQANESSSHSLYSGGGYFQFSEKIGYGVRLSSTYNRYFSEEEKFFHYSVPLFVSYRLTESWGIAFAVGPALSYRIPTFSSNSFYAAGYLSYEAPRFTFGLAVESPGSFRFDSYRGSDRLKEKLPERASVGFNFHWSEQIFIYSELNRIFWERASFSQNEREEAKSFEQGWGRTLFGSLGFGYRLPIGIRTTAGLTNEAFPLDTGRFVRTTGASVGISGELLPSIFGKGIHLASFIQRTAVFGNPSPLGAEFRFGFQVHLSYDSGFSTSLSM